MRTLAAVALLALPLAACTGSDEAERRQVPQRVPTTTLPEQVPIDNPPEHLADQLEVEARDAAGG